MKKYLMAVFFIMLFAGCKKESNVSVHSATLHSWNEYLDFTTGMVTSDTSAKGLDLLWFVNIYPGNDTGVKLHRNWFINANEPNREKYIVYDLGNIDLQNASLNSAIIDSGIAEIRGYLNHTYLTYDMDTNGMITSTAVAFKLSSINGDLNDTSTTVQIDYVYDVK